MSEDESGMSHRGQEPVEQLAVRLRGLLPDATFDQTLAAARALQAAGYGRDRGRVAATVPEPHDPSGPPDLPVD
jgi:hypothetical protein